MQLLMAGSSPYIGKDGWGGENGAAVWVMALVMMLVVIMVTDWWSKGIGII